MASDGCRPSPARWVRRKGNLSKRVVILANALAPLRYEFSGALQEITKAARSLRTLADDLDRHPEAVVVGKRPERRR